MRMLPAGPVFTRADARSMGWSDPAVTRAVRSGRIVRLRRDQFTTATPDLRIAAIAAARGCHGAVISHRSAALMHGLPVVGSLPPVPDVMVPTHGTGDLQAAHLYRATLRPEDVVEVHGEPVTSVARTIIDIGRHRPMATMVAAADFALHETLTTADELRDVLEFCLAWPRADRAARALRRVDGRAESPLESISRLVFIRLHLPAPEPQQRIRNEFGVIIARTDFYWDEYGVAGEADGRIKLRTGEDLIGAWDRHESLDDLGIVVVRWGWDEVVRTPRFLAAKLRRGFERGRRRDALGCPRQWSLAAE